MTDIEKNEFYRLCRVAGGEGAVLLKNEGDILPIRTSETVSLFGRCQIDTYKSGTGSGGAVIPPYMVSILEGVRNSASLSLNEELAKIYEAWVKENPFDNGGGGWTAEPWFQKDLPLTDEVAARARAVSDKAVYIVGRTAGEDKDNAAEEGSYYLTAEEIQNLRVITTHFDKVILLLNTSNLVDLSLLDREFKNSIDAAIYVWHGGMEAGNAVADLLCGAVCPSGKLAATAAYRIADYPSDKNFGSLKQNVYEEDIYVGYRYFETFAPEAVQYPFGFGLSYTTFSIEQVSACADENSASVRVKVTNTGAVSGKEVVQLYAEAPQGRLGKPKKVLAAFAKSPLLTPGESCVLELSFPLYRIASFDDSGVTGFPFSYVLEGGEYVLHLGNSVRNTRVVKFADGGLSFPETVVVEKCRSAMAPYTEFNRMKPGAVSEGIYALETEAVPVLAYSMKERIDGELPTTIPQTGDKGICLMDVKNGKAELADFVAQLSAKEMSVLVRGEGMGNPKVTLGTASAFGGLSDELLDYGIPVACCADGPSGARIESGVYTTLVPIGTLLACSFNMELMEELYTYEGKELLFHKIDSLLGPGMNIQRHPLNGRNFEYFSEDPYVTGAFGAAMLKGMHKSGIEGTAKHFAGNNQETKRTEVDSIISERAIREIYIKGFEIVVKDGGAQSIMTSYNPVNGHWSASNYDLTTSILRKEWGYSGIVMTDWWAHMNDTVDLGWPSNKYMAAMVRAQNDLYMVVANDGAAINVNGDNLLVSLENGTLTLGELQRSAMNICRFILNAPAMGRELPKKSERKFFRAKKDSDCVAMACSTEMKRSAAGNSSEGVCEIPADGIYVVVVNAYYDATFISQSSNNVYLNGELLTNYQLNGTDGAHVEQRLMQVQLEKGFYEIRAEDVKPGLVLEKVGFEKM